MRLSAPGKVNLCLYLGPVREDGLHELCSVFSPIGLADELTVTRAGADEVSCAAVEGQNLATDALAALRELGWEEEPVRIEIEKRIPVAAGLGGGSADAAAVLRLGGAEREGLAEAAMALGADVPSQLEPGLALVEGAGERVQRLADPEPFWLVLLPGGGGLRTPDVFAEADRLGDGRDRRDLAGKRLGLLAATATGASPLEYLDLLENDLERAAVSLRPDIAEALDGLRGAGAAKALLSGSGPTAFGLFESREAAERAAGAVGRADAIVCAGGQPL
jgi:4-diphosphocytidyl-2-C-methyl-D-erythritol kinase